MFSLVQDENLEAFEKARVACPSIETVVVLEAGDLTDKNSKDLPQVRRKSLLSLSEGCEPRVRQRLSRAVSFIVGHVWECNNAAVPCDERNE